MPLQEHPLFSNYGCDTPVIDEIWRSILTLPLFADMTMVELNYVIESLRRFTPN